jgi:hypothetical protein
LLKLLKINAEEALRRIIGYKFAYSCTNKLFMKNIKFLLGLFAVVIVMASCATTQGAMEDDYNNTRTRQIGNRVYMDDPYQGTVVLERDPFTGRYYDVTYGSRYGGGLYGNPYGGYYRRTPPVYQRSGAGRGSVGNGNVVRPQQESREQIRQDRNATRSRVLGNN